MQIYSFSLTFHQIKELNKEKKSVFCQPHSLKTLLCTELPLSLAMSAKHWHCISLAMAILSHDVFRCYPIY